MRRTIGSILVWQTTASACYYTVFAATPFLRDAFALSRFGVGLVVAALTLGQLAFLLPAGAVVDCFGERRALVAGLGGLAVATVGLGLARSLVLVGLSAFGLGLAYSVATPGTNRAVFESIPVGRRNLGMGIKQVGVTGGSALASVGVPAIAVTRFGWRSGFVVAAGLAVVVTLGFAASYDGSDGEGAFSLPTMDGAFGDRSYLLLVVTGLFLGSALFVTSSYTVLFLHESVGVPVTVAGATLAGMQAAGSVGRVLFGGLVDRLPQGGGRSATLVLLGQTSVVVVCLFAIVGVTGTTPTILVSLVLGFFMFGFTGVYFSAIAAFAPGGRVGGASAAPQMALNVGALVAPPAFGLVVDGYGYHLGWAVAGVLAAVAVLVLGGVYRRARRGATRPDGNPG